MLQLYSLNVHNKPHDEKVILFYYFALKDHWSGWFFSVYMNRNDHEVNVPVSVQHVTVQKRNNSSVTLRHDDLSRWSDRGTRWSTGSVSWQQLCVIMGWPCGPWSLPETPTPPACNRQSLRRSGWWCSPPPPTGGTESLWWVGRHGSLWSQLDKDSVFVLLVYISAPVWDFLWFLFIQHWNFSLELIKHFLLSACTSFVLPLSLCVIKPLISIEKTNETRKSWCVVGGSCIFFLTLLNMYTTPTLTCLHHFTLMITGSSLMNKCGLDLSYLLCIHWWHLIRHRLTQCPNCWWVHPEGKRQGKLVVELTQKVDQRVVVITKIRTSGWRQDSSAKTTLAFWPPVGEVQTRR